MALSVDSLIQKPELSARQLARGRSLGNIAVSTDKEYDRPEKSAFSGHKKTTFSKQLQREKSHRKDESKTDVTPAQVGQNNAVDTENRAMNKASTSFQQRNKNLETKPGGLQKDGVEPSIGNGKDISEGSRVSDQLLVDLTAGIKHNNNNIQQSVPTAVGQISASVNRNEAQIVSEGSGVPSQIQQLALDGNNLPFQVDDLPPGSLKLETMDISPKLSSTETVSEPLDNHLNLIQEQLSSRAEGAENKQQIVAGLQHKNLEQTQQTTLNNVVSPPNKTSPNPDLDGIELKKLNDKINTILSSGKLTAEHSQSDALEVRDSLKLPSHGKLSVEQGLSKEQLLNLLTDKSQQRSNLTSNLESSPIVKTNANQQNGALSGLIMPQIVTSTSTDLNSQLPVTYQIRQGLQSPAWAGNFVQNIAQMTLNNRNLAEVRLDPPELGSIMVKIHQQSRDATIQFHVQNVEAKTAVENSLIRLREALVQQGFSQVNVDVQQQSSQFSQHNQMQADDTNFHVRKAGDGVEADIPLPAVTPIYLEQSTGIDIFA